MAEPLILNAGGQLFRFHYEELDRPLFMVLGAALAEAQALEFRLSLLLRLATSTNTGRPTDTLSTDTLSDEYLSRTLGFLARKIREMAPGDETAAKLDELVERRNYLVHRCLREYGWPMSTVEEYAKAVQEIEAIRTILSDGSVTVTLAMQKAQSLNIIVIGTNPDTGLPELVG